MYNFMTFLVVLMGSAWAQVSLWDRPDWSEGVRIQEIRGNIYEVDSETLKDFDRRGRLNALWYPVPVTGLKVPFKPIEFLSNPTHNPWKELLLKTAEITINISSPDDLYEFMGFKQYPTTEGEGSYFVPFIKGQKPVVRIGVAFGESNGAQYVTASCTLCHTESLFGRPVIGLPNKTPRANETFHIAHKVLPKIPGKLFKLATKATDAEVALWKKAQKTMNWIGVKEPQVLGLDTSLATVALSLAKRDFNPYATVSEASYKNPRPDVLNTFVADSKPMPWFVLKYKNRWLSDGSVVSGNPILTNILWNEVGRGADLKELEEWVNTPKAQQDIVELTSAVFGTTPPKYVEFFGKKSINVESAQRGELLFNQSCYKCHGVYKKDWETLETVEVNYPEMTEVKDVGTDPNRWMGMKELSKDLNRLSFSETFGIKVIPQKGYVPPPLVGIWARWPYFHNNSAPTLCDVLRKPELRRKSWYVGSPVDPKLHYDQECNGFPLVAPKEWQKKERFFDTSKAGLTNTGHSKHEYSEAEIRDLIQYLKTL